MHIENDSSWRASNLGNLSSDKETEFDLNKTIQTT